MAVSQIIGASIADGTIAAIDITDGTITTAKLAATTGSGNVVLSAAPTLTGNTSLVNLTVSGTQTNSTLTSGRVRYSTTGGVLTDSSKLTFDGANLGVGITPNAWSSLLVGLQISTSAVFSGQDGSEVMRLGSNWYYSSGFKYIGTGNATVYDQNSGTHAWSTSPSGTAGNAITFTQAMTLDASGYLGIGTTSPSSYGGLAVRKAATVSSVPVSASFSDSANSTFDIRHSANIVNLSAQGSGITINTGNSTRMTITDAGLVGIGITSPSVPLHILNSGEELLRLATSGVNPYLSFYTGTSTRKAYIQLTSSGLVLDSEAASTGQLFLTQGVERMRISSNGQVMVSTTGVNGTVKITSTDGAGGYGANMVLKNSGTGGREYWISSTSNGDGEVSGGKLKFYDSTANVTRMLIDADGDVGIGIFNPISKLHISGSNTYAGGGLLLGSASAVSGYIWTTDHLYIKPNNSGGTVSGAVYIQNISEVNRFAFDTSTIRLGVGIASPSSALDISGVTDGLSRWQMRVAQAYTLQIHTNVTDTAYADAWHDAGLYKWQVNGTEKMRLHSNGYLGIGTTTPNAKLSINTTTFTSVADTAQVAIENTDAWTQGLAFYIWGAGTYNSGYASGYIGSPNTSGRLFMSGGARVIDNPDGGGNWAKSLNTTAASFINVGESGIHFNSNYGLTVNTAYTPTLRMKIGTNGYVGIGTSDPYTPLHVAGTIKTAPTNQSGVVAFGGTTNTTTQLGIFRGTANSTSDGNWLNMAGYEGLTFSVSAANIGSQTERMRIDSSGNVGIGVTPSSAFASSAYRALQLGQRGVIMFYETGASILNVGTNFYYDGSAYRRLTADFVSQYQQATGEHNWRIAGTGAADSTISFTQAMTLNASSQLSVGTTTAAATLNVMGQTSSTSTPILYLQQGGASPSYGYTFKIDNVTTGDLYLNRYDNNTDGGNLLTVRTDGSLLVGRTSQGSYSQKLNLLQTSASVGGIQSWCDSASFTNSVITARASRATTNNSYTYFQCSQDGVGDKLYIFDSGNVYNTTGTYGTLSDIKLKENIVDATSKLNDVMALKVRNFNLKSEPELKQIGFIAQELETIFPSMVEETLDQTKIVKTTVLIPILVKAIQEQQALIESLTSRLTALEGK